MKIQFDSQQQYQVDAVNAVLDVFDGQPLAQGQFEIGPAAGTAEFLSELGFGNQLVLPEERVLENLRAVQATNGIEKSGGLDGMNFTTEMETGTGKTYVYLRTIHELHARYGFNKFVIAVPSVAIREGVKTSIELTREHFRTLFDEQPFDYWVYDSKRVSSLRQFATSNQLQILIINIDAFNKPTNNVIHQENDRLSGHKPIEFIQATNPIVIMDEPQNMESGLEKELRIHKTLPEERRLKVLSLFFIDKVANYADEEGKIRRWFVEAYEELSKQRTYAALSLLPVDDVHNGYFAQDRSGPKDTTGKTKADDEAYEIIMKDKERLLSSAEPLRFIFSHSALREGWDNPNVFQICTLNESRTELRKRQEIGRGLRLPVDASGERSFDPNINKLTVIANESYAEFASALQNEIEEETGVKFEGRVVNKRQRRKANLKENWRLDEDFKELWDRIKHKTRYSVDYDTQELVARASEAVAEMPEIKPPNIITERRDLEITAAGVTTQLLAFRDEALAWRATRVPDLLGHVQRGTELTRGTIVEILTRSGRLGDVKMNPQQFMDGATRAIRKALDDLMVDGIKYERVTGPDGEYEMLLFEEKEIDGYEDRMLEVKKSIYDAIEYDSGPEERFAKDLDTLDDIKLFVKLPSWFKVETPIGTYNPDWAIVKRPDTEEKLYLVSETKSDLDSDKRRKEENVKIRCGEAHFGALPDIEYKVVNDARQV